MADLPRLKTPWLLVAAAVLLLALLLYVMFAGWLPAKHQVTRLEAELKDCGGSQLFEEVEMPLVTVLADMEMAGITLDTDFLKQMSQELSTRLSAIETQIYEACGGPFNLNSPPQLSEMLFNRLQIAPPNRTAKTATGFYSTSADILESLRGKHRVVDWVLEYRELSKLKSTYLDAHKHSTTSPHRRPDAPPWEVACMS